MDTLLPNNPVGSYEEGAFIDFVVVLTAAHKGHFLYKVSLQIRNDLLTNHTYLKHSVPRITLLMTHIYNHLRHAQSLLARLQLKHALINIHSHLSRTTSTGLLQIQTFRNGK